MRPDLVSVLRCPVCGEDLGLHGRTAKCERGHSYDLAKQGYLNLLPSASTGIEGDTAEMIEARSTFLAAGSYSPIRDALIANTPEELDLAQLDRGDGELVVEVGAGTAYYLAGVVAARTGWRGIALDVSRYAARRAAKVDPRIGAVVCDAWRELPLRDEVAQVILNVFAPRNAQEMARILAPGGTLLVVTPNQTHLGELVDVLGLVRVDQEKERRLTESLSGFQRTTDEAVEVTMRLDHRSIERLVAMTPSARHLDQTERAERIAVLADPAEVTLSVTVSAWQVVA
ncbi:23S rRNA (guanine745-N1)-methyltransferase [Kribbella sp. VKM Ac-2527]|uniref:23S rRNA (Guanine745-N1)-methyltransferase n=1 Tax=Kribbella caucasensis TaxID=2512215 RepID=A0A4R6KIH9_9ACTN|nr:methyltransferase domain-containing protein [Kribbella sp. VKM Ac-2527]TDO50112.1 23S rRNA (guanine745-N1)-methyltransferase [Kribbella sp. VKM Ac-2527]